MAWTSSPSHFWRFLSFARGQYRRTAPTRKIQNLSHFLEVYQRVEIYNLISCAFLFTNYYVCAIIKINNLLFEGRL